MAKKPASKLLVKLDPDLAKLVREVSKLHPYKPSAATLVNSLVRKHSGELSAALTETQTPKSIE